MNKNRYKLVNWQESMGVGAHHLQQTENYFIERLGDNMASRLTGYNYGLLPSRKTLSSKFDINETVTGTVEIKLQSCNAITADGYRIAYNPNNSEYLLHTHSFNESDQNNAAEEVMSYWDIVISVNPFGRTPDGAPDEDETPPRHPNVMERYSLSIAPQGHIKQKQLGRYHIVIGRIRKNDGIYQVDSSYIPSCTSMCSHTDLLNYYDKFGEHLHNIERASKVILSKIHNRDQNLPLALHIAMMCENMMRYISTMLFRYRNMGRDAAPIEIADYFSTLAHSCYISLSFISKGDKEELLKYFYEWSDVTPGSFEELLSETLSISYDHSNIRQVMGQLENFLKVISELWLKLSTLEYIGQHKENIVISERSYQKEIKRETGNWTILD